MCVIAIHNAGDRFPREEFRQMWRSNSDGGGYMFQRPGERVVIRKPFWTAKSMYANYVADVKANPDTPFVLHFRITTHGAENKMNTHPHRLPNKCAVAHNGVISGFGDNVWGKYGKLLGGSGGTADSISDTVDYCRTILGRLPRYWWRNPAIRYLIQEDIGRGNKIAIMPDHGKIVVLNRKGWYARNKRLYSNLGWMRTSTKWASCGSASTQASAQNAAASSAMPGVYRSTYRAEKPEAVMGDQTKQYATLDKDVVYKRVCTVCGDNVTTDDRALAHCGCEGIRWLYFGTATPASRFSGWVRYRTHSTGWVPEDDEPIVISDNG